MHSLPIFVRIEGRAVVLVGDGEAAAAKRRLLDRAGAVVVSEESPAALAIVAIEDEAEAVAAVARLRARGVLVNAVDRPALCDFTLPAIVDRDPVLIAIGTGGASAGLAKVVRQRLEAMLPASLGRLATAMATAKAAMRARWPDGTERRRAIEDALGGPLDPFVEQEPDAVERWLAAKHRPEPVELVRVRLSSTDPDELTLRVARLMGRADRVYHRANVPAVILDRARADAERIMCDAPPVDVPAGLAVDLSLA